jgi:hypothetical protein
VRERTLNSGIALRATAGGGAPLTSKSFRAPLRQANKGGISFRSGMKHAAEPAVVGVKRPLPSPGAVPTQAGIRAWGKDARGERLNPRFHLG